MSIGVEQSTRKEKETQTNIQEYTEKRTNRRNRQEENLLNHNSVALCSYQVHRGYANNVFNLDNITSIAYILRCFIENLSLFIHCNEKTT